jgi:HAD superfamily hydrolase (TIGR01458 family)
MSLVERPTDRIAPSGALASVRGLLLDLDGVLIAKNEALPGAAAALRELRSRGIPFRVMTNTSSMSRATLARLGQRTGLEVPADHIISSLSVTAAFTARAYSGQPLYVLASDDARTEFAGQHLLAHEQAGQHGARAAAVVVGDSPDDVTYDTLNRAFRLAQDGAALIGMHRNRWWLTPEGPRLDAGAFVAGLEYALERPARILGKPAREFFAEGVREIGRDLARTRPGDSRSRLIRHDVAMVGDDLWFDVLAAQRAGLRGVLVLSGKHGMTEVARAVSQRRGGGSPTAIAPSLAEVVAALD